MTLKIHSLKKLPRLPGHRSPPHVDVELRPAEYEQVEVKAEVWEEDEDGREQLISLAEYDRGDLISDAVVVRLHKAKARDAIPVSTRLLALLGPDLYQLVAHSDDQDPENPLAALMSLDWDDPASVKTVVIGVLMPMMQDKFVEVVDTEGAGSASWYFERLIGKYVEYDGYRTTCLEDLDEIGFSLGEVVQIFWKAVELALFPMLGARATKPGQSSPRAPDTEPRAKSSSSSRDGHVTETGQSVRMSRTRG